MISSSVDALGGGATAMIISGGLSGGIGAKIAGGDFWNGASQGLITSGLNHVVHSASNSFNNEDILPDGRMLWELSDEEFTLFHTPEGRESLFGGRFDIQLSVAERVYWFGKQLGLVIPTAKVVGFGKTMFNSKLFGYKSKWLGRKHPGHLPNGVKGKFNQGNIRTGWGWNNTTGRHTFRTGIGKTGRHIDWFQGPKY